MKKAYRLLRDRRSMYFGIAVLGVCGIGAFAAGNASADESLLNALATNITCSSTATACVKGNNTNTGSGVTGKSADGPGVLGQGTSSYGVKATSSKNYGVFGSSTSGLAGVAGTTASTEGVYGYVSGNSGGAGVYGTSQNGYGVYGDTKNGGIGVYGFVSAAGGIGVEGESDSGYGLEGYSGNGYAMYADAFNGGSAIVAYANTGYGVSSTTNGGPAFFGRNSNGIGGDFQGTTIGIYGATPAKGYPLYLTDEKNVLFSVDGVGNVTYKGSLSNFARLANGGSAKSYSAKSTLPTVEDTGTAQLVNGSAVVRLDPTFAGSIDESGSYRVFVTPNGDTRGLFVATKTAKGFIVREAQAGHSSVTFDYRIVATALGQVGQRMAPATLGLAEAVRTLASPPKPPVVRPALPRH